MGNLIDRAATFRGNILEHGVGLTTNEFPQMIAKLQAEEIYDEDEKTWVNLAEAGIGETNITAYLVLFGGNGKETLTSKQVQKVTGWDGLSFLTLNDADLSQIKIQFRVEEHTYEGKESLQVAWIDEYNAEPGRTIRRLDAEGLKQLDAKYGLRGNKPAPVKVQPVNLPPKIGPKLLPNCETSEVKQPGTIKVKGKPSRPGKPVTKIEKPPVPLEEGEVGSCTKQEAWDAVCEVLPTDRTPEIDQKLAVAWQNAVKKFGGGKPQELLGENEWFAVKDFVVAQIAKF